MNRKLAVSFSAVALIATAGVVNTRAGFVDAPRFEVDALWPKPLPNHWILGSAVGVAVDAGDHVFVLSLNDVNETGGPVFNSRTEVGASTVPPSGECCNPAPNVLEFDANGVLVGHWGAPATGYVWPKANHRISIDRAGNAWIGGVGAGDARALKLTRAGVLVSSVTGVGRVMEVAPDPAANEAYVADAAGRRVVVIDATTGAIKREWGAYGSKASADSLPAYNKDAPPAKQFRNVHCIEPSIDGNIYVCDRESNRVQVFRKDGTFVKEKFIAPATGGAGCVWDIAFSRDPQQRYMYIADGQNMKVRILDRLSLEELTTFGTGGRQPGQFFAVHSVATDSRGNLYTAETSQGKRVQKFVFKGIGPVTINNQGVVWPK
jgi:DNA-binding beta-propeller fold protein YncE